MQSFLDIKNINVLHKCNTESSLTHNFHLLLVQYCLSKQREIGMYRAVGITKCFAIYQIKGEQKYWDPLRCSLFAV